VSWHTPTAQRAQHAQHSQHAQHAQHAQLSGKIIPHKATAFLENPTLRSDFLSTVTTVDLAGNNQAAWRKLTSGSPVDLGIPDFLNPVLHACITEYRIL